ncbi:MAG TPA: NAD(P)-dependent oxidoreductase [Vicinamibacterales bacterium]|nr:NAD(P)-dependent oxidoreductase [Vicinamibacterales bacterium]
MANLGYVGLGAMGGRTADRLLAKGHTVIGYNRTKSKAQWLIDKGMQWADTPREVARAADITFVMVTDSRALAAVAEGPDGLLEGLGPGKTLVDMSTVSPDASRALADKVRQRGAEMLDCPVSGSVSTLEAGKATMMVGGDRATFERVHPVLLDIGPKATYVGPNGAAVSMKIALNLSIGVQLLAFAESVLLAEKSGIERKTAIDVFLNSVLASPMLQYRGPFALGLPEEAWFDVNMMQKDTSYALDMGRQLGVVLPTGAIANQFLTAARGLGLEKEDCAVLFHVLAKLSGVQA